MMVGNGVVVRGIVVFALDNAAKIPLELASILVSSNSLSIVRWVRIGLKSARLSRESSIYGSHVMTRGKLIKTIKLTENIRVCVIKV